MKFIGFAKIAIALGIAALGFSGCVSAKNATAGQIGCNPDDITISDTRTITSVDYWEATCKNKKYACSGSGNLIFQGYTLHAANFNNKMVATA